MTLKNRCMYFIIFIRFLYVHTYRYTHRYTKNPTTRNLGFELTYLFFNNFFKILYQQRLLKTHNKSSIFVYIYILRKSNGYTVQTNITHKTCHFMETSYDTTQDTRLCNIKICSEEIEIEY